MPVSSDHVLEIRQGTVILGGTTVLDGTDFFVRRDEFVALLGENGSGKTTLVRSLLGLVHLSSGSARLFGEPIASFRDWARIGYVPQRFTAAAGVPATVEEVVTSGRAARAPLFRPSRSEERSEVGKAIEAAGLTRVAGKRVSTLSGGQQQRVLIARALATDPDVLVLDEPVSSVDVENQEAFAATLGRFRSEGKSVLLVAHSLGAMRSLVDRAVVLAGGGIVYEGPPRAVDSGELHVHHEPAAELGTGAYRTPSGGGT